MSERHEISSTGLIGFAIWIAVCVAGLFWIAS